MGKNRIEEMAGLAVRAITREDPVVSMALLRFLFQNGMVRNIEDVVHRLNASPDDRRRLEEILTNISAEPVQFSAFNSLVKFLKGCVEFFLPYKRNPLPSEEK